MKKLLLVLFLAALAFPWTAYQNNPKGMLDNPAYLGWINENEALLWAHDGENVEFSKNHGLLFNFNGLGFGYTQNYGMEDYNLGLGFSDSRQYVSFGYLYNWNKYQRNTKNGWSIGAMIQPGPWLSIGWSYTDPARFSASHYKAGLAVRPLGRFLTLFADGDWDDKSQIDDGQYSAGAELALVKGLRFYGSYDFENEDATIGARFDMPNIGYMAEVPVDSSGETGAMFYGIHSSTHRFRSIFPGGPKRMLSLKLDGSIVEQKHWSLFGNNETSLIDIISNIRIAQKSKEIKSIEIIWDSPSIGFSEAVELRKALVESGKEIRFYARVLDNVGYFMASCADEVVMAPEGYLMLVGLSAEINYYKGTLDKIGVKFDVVHAGKFKDPGIYTEDSMPPQVKEEYDSLLNSYYSLLLTAVADKCGDTVKAKQLVNGGPYTSEQAVKIGLVDTTMFEKDFRTYAKGIRVNGKTMESFKMRNEDFAGGRTIAVIYADGEIVDGSGGGRGLFSSTKFGSDDLRKCVDAVLADPSVEAVVLRVNSPGGSAQASEEMWHELNRIKEKGLPLVVSMGSVAASGGYYISTLGDRIFAEDATITGSIGVIMMKPSIGGLMDKIGVNVERLKRGDNAGIFTLTDTLSSSQKARIESSIAETYMTFKTRVSDGRKMSLDKVESLAQGRIYTGPSALRNGLVDEIGGLTKAVEYSAGLADVKDYTVRAYNRSGFYSQLFESLGNMNKAPEIKIFGEKISLPEFPYKSGEPLYLEPYQLRIK